MKRYLLIAISAIVVLGGQEVKAEQKWNVKTNLLYDALLNANLGIELKVAPRWSVDVSGNYNGWKLSHGRQWKHWMVQPEARYWLKEGDFKGSFFAAHLFGGEFNTTLRNYRRQGWAAGIGVGYGYSWRFADHWGLEAEIAVGYARYGYDKYPCASCGRKIASRQKNYVGPTKAAVNLAYYFGGKDKPAAIVDLPEEPVVEIVEIAETIVKDTLPSMSFPLVDVPHKKILTENLSVVARVRFKVNRTDIDTSFADNGIELNSITGKLDSIRHNLGMEVHSIKLTGYASPEGKYTNNDRLASGRTLAMKSFLESSAHLPEGVVSVNHIAEDWRGLRSAIEASELDDKEALLRIIDSDMAPDAKESALRRHRASWAYISKDVLPGLRRTEYRIEYQHRYETTELQTLERVNRNISDGNIEEAARLLVDIPSSPEADYARGVVAALQHRYDEAKAWFERAKSRGVVEASAALNELEMKTKKLKY